MKREQIEAKLRVAEEQIAVWRNSLALAQEQVATWQGKAYLCRELLAEDAAEVTDTPIAEESIETLAG